MSRVAGFASGGADVHLEENDDGTLLKYVVNIDISGKLAQVGGRLIEGTSKRIAKKFFQNFEEALMHNAVPRAGYLSAMTSVDKSEDGLKGIHHRRVQRD